MNKQQRVNELNRYMMAKSLAMFEYSGLPDSIPEREFERILQHHGFAFVTMVDGELYALSGGLGGERDAYKRATTINVANPYLKLSTTFNLADDGVLVCNDDERMGTIGLMNRFHSLMVENTISMDLASFNARVTTFLSASDDKTRDSAERFLKKMRDGEQAVIADNAMFEGVTTHSGSKSGGARITDLIEYQQFLKASLYGELGINAPFNMKRERLNSSEVTQHEDSLDLFIDNMKACRDDAIEKINEKYGTEINCKFAGIWEHKNEEKNIMVSDSNAETNVEISDEQIEQETEQMIDEPETKTIAEYLDGENLFDAIATKGNYPFIDETTNKIFITMYGRSPLFSEIEANTVDELATMVAMMYGDKWNDLIESTGAEFGAVETVKTIETVASDEAETQKVSAYNDEALVDDSGSDITGTVERDSSTSKFTNDSTYQALQMSDKLAIIRVAMADVANFMKLSVY